ncbi:MAG: hypothetical protein A2X25_09570 [Chloroflexi bacterium GWB2_49_20]|nr:MAG: hypothetical protein A2X25_09570 [Chloroflexi bacterium GWB2_49_20]OGN79643.1 MAG: hypothetical protein A2X26_04455 [Chloroflexi bacterium GWC2_49_37]OGN83045.1 MAG: hypothetical protein A2X27_08240 [Chloroflexi bacterium GWD2_49_16]
MKFDFSTVNRIVFGARSIDEVPKVIDTFGKKAFVIRSSQAMGEISLTDLMASANKEYIIYDVKGEPSETSIIKAVKVASDNHCDFVIGIGGGSVLDTAKVVATMMTNKGELMDYLETVGKGFPVRNRCAPNLAIPTTAGTGSEVTRNAVIDIPDKKLKVSMRSTLMLPWVSMIDPLLTLSLPPKITAFTGMDAFIQVMESFVSVRANVMTDSLCIEAIKKAAIHLRKTYHHGDNITSRTEMCFVSLIGGMALANSGLGAVHGFAGAIGSIFHAPHGAVCASLVTAVMKVNVSALMKRNPNGEALTKYQEIFKMITSNQTATYKDGIQWFIDLCGDLDIPTLKKLGVNRGDFPEIVRLSKTTSSMKANPILLVDGELLEILELAYE